MLQRISSRPACLAFPVGWMRIWEVEISFLENSVPEMVAQQTRNSPRETPSTETKVIRIIIGEPGEASDRISPRHHFAGVNTMFL